MTGLPSELEYEARALPELSALVRALDALDEAGLEVELSNDILTIEFQDGTRYVVNSHRAARQIWMAAERNAWHFDWDPESGTWVARKSQSELWATLKSTIETKLGKPIALERAGA